MMDNLMPFNDDHGTLPVSLARHVDQACASFEAAWTAGQRPRLEDFLDTVSESARPSAIRELILLDVHYRRLAGEEPQAADYQARFPDIDPEWLAEVVAARFDAQPKSSQIGASKLVESIGEGLHRTTPPADGRNPSPASPAAALPWPD